MMGKNSQSKSGSLTKKESIKGVSSKQSVTIKEKLAGLKIWQLMGLLLVVIGGALLFVGAVSGWFGDPRIKLDPIYYCGEKCKDEMMELSSTEYEELLANGASFVVFVDQSGCTTADRLRGYVSDWAAGRGVSVYRMMFAEAKKTSMHDYVKYYPSVVLVGNGHIREYLRADSDEDVEQYNDQQAFDDWMNRYL